MCHYKQEGRGFSFDSTDEIDMRINRTEGYPVSQFVMKASEKQLADVIFNFSQERAARKIARKIIHARRNWDTVRAAALAQVIRSSYPPGRRYSFPHPATKVFQALRIYVNNELERLRKTLVYASQKLKIGGKIIVISFHSLEDRIVKHFFKNHIAVNQPEQAHAEVCVEIISKKPIRPDEKERKENPSSRSARMRVARRIE